MRDYVILVKEDDEYGDVLATYTINTSSFRNAVKLTSHLFRTEHKEHNMRTVIYSEKHESTRK